jgi:hypothetical protein
MRKISFLIVPALLASMAVGTVSAEARTPGRAEAIRAQIAQLDRAVDRSDGRDRISEREAAGIRRDVRDLQWQFRNYNRGGLNNREMALLESRIHSIRARLHMERRDRDGRRG